MFKDSFISGDRFFDIPETDTFKHFNTDDAWNAFAFILKAKKDRDTPYTLLTHNSDWSTSMLLNEVGLDPKDLPNNLFWFAQNVDTDHSKIRSIPIGLENEHWHPGKNDIIESYKIDMEKGEYLCCALFNPSTHPSREIAFDHFEDKKWCITKSTTNGQNIKEYFELLNKSLFCICPRGNGIDTHRFWEAIYMGCIPVVERCLNVNFYKKLPIVICDSFLDITEDYLMSKIHGVVITALESDYQMADFKYWERKILKKVNRENI